MGRHWKKVENQESKILAYLCQTTSCKFYELNLSHNIKYHNDCDDTTTDENDGDEDEVEGDSSLIPACIRFSQLYTESATVSAQCPSCSSLWLS